MVPGGCNISEGVNPTTLKAGTKVRIVGCGNGGCGRCFGQGKTCPILNKVMTIEVVDPVNNEEGVGVQYSYMDGLIEKREDATEDDLVIVVNDRFIEHKKRLLS
jgi:hypothetical protein